MNSRLPAETAERLRRLTSVSRAITNAASLDAVFELAAECAVDLVAGRRALIAVAGDDGRLRIRGARGVDAAAAATFHHPLDEHVATAIEAVFGSGAGVRFAGVPVVVGGRIIGLLAVELDRAGPADEHDEWLLSALADQTSLAIEAARGVAARGALEAKVRRLEAGRADTDRAVRIVSHDLRTPLASIQGYVELLTSGVYGPVTERQTEALERIRTVAHHLKSVIEGIVEVTRLATADPAVDISEISLDPVLREAAALIAPVAATKRIAVRLESDPELRVEADPDRLRQIIVHVLDNAVKYCPADTSVEIVARAGGRHGGDFAVVSIADEGPGVPAAHADEIFLPSRRLQQGGSDDPGGSGLGLWIARSLLERMGGSIELDSAASPGATFRLSLPLVVNARAG